MSKTLIIGATGKIGRIVTQNMLAKGDSVVALVRDKSKLSHFPNDTLEIVECDLEDDFSHAFTLCDKVIFCAGSGGNTGADKTMLVDLWAAYRAIDYAKDAQIEQFVMLSSIGAGDPSGGPKAMQPYLVAKYMADEHLMSSALNYTIFRPGSLQDAPAKERFESAVPRDKAQMVITREDVASALIYAQGNKDVYNQCFTLFNGQKTLEDALSHTHSNN